jgi:hypothetical protein
MPAGQGGSVEKVTAVINITSSDLPKRRYEKRDIHTRDSYGQILARMAASGERARPGVLRALVLALVALLLVFAGLMAWTGRYELGAPVLGGILLISFGAAQYARKE